MRPIEITELLGETFRSVSINDDKTEMVLVSEPYGNKYKFYHPRDCCEQVTMEEMDGDPEWLVGSPIILAGVQTARPEKPTRDDSETWTFYKLGTVKGACTFRWYGSSNGYYGEDVSIVFEEGNSNETIR
jgi:hypothetical protein